MDEKVRQFWIGKNPKVQKAVMEYLELKNRSSTWSIAKKYGISHSAIIVNVKALKQEGLITQTPPRRRICCLICGKTVSGTFPRILVVYQLIDPNKWYRNKGSSKPIKPRTAYLCMECTQEKIPELKTLSSARANH